MKPATALLVGLLGCVATSAAAQTGVPVRPFVPGPKPLVALAKRDLTFGTVLPGIPFIVHPLNTRHAGVFEVHGTADASVRVEFLLPLTLGSAAGDAMDIAFAPGDGFADFSYGKPPRGLVFDPRGPVISALGPNGRLVLHLGATVLPRRTQTAGIYTAIISITVYDLGS